MMNHDYEKVTRIKPLCVISKSTTEVTYDDPLIVDAIQLIHDHATKGITAEALINRLGCARRSIETRFKTQLNTTIGKYIIKTQMQKAAELLTSSDQSIGQISLDVGYKNQRYFSKVFKNHFNVSPSQYRKTHN